MHMAVFRKFACEWAGMTSVELWCHAELIQEVVAACSGMLELTNQSWLGLLFWRGGLKATVSSDRVWIQALLDSMRKIMFFSGPSKMWLVSWWLSGRGEWANQYFLSLFLKITVCFNGANVETQRLFQVWLCLQGISTLTKWLWLIDGSIIIWRAHPALSWSDINYDVVGAARRCQIVKKKMLQMYSLKWTGEI